MPPSNAPPSLPRARTSPPIWHASGCAPPSSTVLRRPRATAHRPPRHEADARANLRRVRGDELTIEELLGETELLAARLNDEAASLDLLIAYIPRWPHEEVLHAMLRERSISLGRLDDYAQGLLNCVDQLDDPVQRDALLRRRAFLQMELMDAQGVLATLNRMQPESAAKAELLDLRDWAIRELGELDTELDALDQDLLANPDDPISLQRLVRSLDRNLGAAAKHLLRLHHRKQETGECALARRGLSMALEASNDVNLLVEFAGALAMAGDAEGIQEHWGALCSQILESKDDVALASLISAAVRLEAHRPLEPGSEELLHRGFARAPASEALHACFWQSHDIAELDEAELAFSELERMAELEGLRSAQLWIGFVSRLGKTRARPRALTPRSRTSRRPRSLSQAGRRPRSREPVGPRPWPCGKPASTSSKLPRKHSPCSSTWPTWPRTSWVIPKPPSTTSSALASSTPPTSDLLLPLLDHYYAQPQLDRAIALSHQVLEHVPMGNVAYAALGNRAADAALARGEHKAAQALLARVLERVPEDQRTLLRAEELRQLAADPEHRAEMLAAIASRQAGSARTEALEERARLLSQELGRHEEAISDLESALADAPGRQPATGALMDL